jgi:hypothetical protein
VVGDEVVVTVHEYPEAELTAPDRACVGIPVTLDGSGSSCPTCLNGLSYRYSVLGGSVVQDWSGSPYFTFTPTAAGTTTYEMEVYCNDRPECADAAPAAVEVEECSLAVRYGWYRADERSDGTVAVKWETLSESDTLAFSVLRDPSPDKPGVRRPRCLVTAHGPGLVYEVADRLDEGVSASEVLYQIVEITASGPGDATPLFGVSTKGRAASIERTREGDGNNREETRSVSSRR